MSFGFSVSDCVGLAAVVYKIYCEFKEASRACQDFAKQLILFHHILGRIGNQFSSNDDNLDYRDLDQDVFSECVNSCKELVYVQIGGAVDVSSGIRTFETLGADVIWRRGSDGVDSLLKAWRQKWAQRKFSMQIPKLQHAVSMHVQSLTAFNTLIARYASCSFIRTMRSNFQVLQIQPTQHV